MAEIKERKRKNGEVSYTASIRIKGSPSLTKTFKRKTDAKEWASRTETEIRENINFPKRRLQKMTIGELIDRFIKNELPKKSLKIQRDFLNSLNWYNNEIGKLYVKNVTSAQLVECREKLSAKPKEIPIKGKKPRATNKVLSSATVNRYMMYMRVVFAYCVNDLDILDVNPMAKVKKLPENNTRKRCLEQKEIKKLLEACLKTDYELYLCVLIALLTGARKSEILNLTWATIDLDHKMFYFLNTKNGTDRGTPMHEVLYNELKGFKGQNRIRRLKDDYLFMTADGKQKETLIGKLFPKVVKICEITDFRFHDLRHTGASWQAMSGVSQPITQKILGHKSPAMTNRYSHLSDENSRPTINSVGNVMLKEWLNEKAERGV